MLTAAGDILTLPALVAASYLIRIPVLSPLLALALAALAAAALLYGFRRGSDGLRRILAESLPILAATGTIMILVGLALEDRLEHFLTFPALLILLPAFLQLGGALGGILASRLASKMHLGLLEPRGLPQLAAVRDFTLTYIFAGGVYVFIGAASHLLAVGLGQASPGLLLMAGLTVLAGLLATTASVLAAYYGSAVSYRFGLDPDTYGIPIITASVDLLGFISLIISLVVFGLAG
jgi:mgtE-like transporter